MARPKRTLKGALVRLAGVLKREGQVAAVLALIRRGDGPLTDASSGQVYAAAELAQFIDEGNAVLIFWLPDPGHALAGADLLA